MKKIMLALTLSIVMLISLSACGTSADKPATEPAEIGVTQTIKNLETTITGYEFSIYAGALNGLSEVSDGFKYCVVYLDVKNIGSGALETDDYTFTLYYHNNDKIYHYLGTWANYSEFLYANDSIPALGTLDNVCLCFKVPTEVEDNVDCQLTIELKENRVSATNKAVWALR